MPIRRRWRTYWVLFITYTASAIPLATWILVGFFAAVPKEIEESATIDGAGLWNRLRHVMLPIAWPGVVTAGVLCIREAWNEFAFVLALVTETGMRTLPYQLYMLKDSMGVQDYAVYNAFGPLGAAAADRLSAARAAGGRKHRLGRGQVAAGPPERGRFGLNEDSCTRTVH